MKYGATKAACYLSYIVQASASCITPLLFVTFHRQFHIPMEQITLLITLHFLVELCMDVFISFAADHIGYRTSMVLAHTLTCAGFLAMAFLPMLLPSPFAALCIAVCLSAAGAGIIEVLISPIIHCCPGRRREAAMSLLHSFYCWGCVLAIAVSTAYFAFFGQDNWRGLLVLWAILPFLSGIWFVFLPIPCPSTVQKRASHRLPVRQISPFLIIMFCAGACEHAMSQWASTIAEAELHLPKQLGDLGGPLSFAILMGTGRLLFGLLGQKRSARRILLVACGGCCLGYLLCALAPIRIALLGFGIGGFSAAILWPCCCALAVERIPDGGTALFAYLAIAGDLGCTLGPTAVGLLAGLPGLSLRMALLCAVCFPIVEMLVIYALRDKKADVDT